jgi:hypothetical protein
MLKGYWYQEGYIRTSSAIFSLKNLNNNLIHLTNDAVQAKSEDYGKFEQGNKVPLIFRSLIMNLTNICNSITLRQVYTDKSSRK